MSTRPSLVRSIPFWGLVVASAGTTAYGAYILNGTLGSMTSTLTDGTATGVDVYVGQSVAQLGTSLVGAGVIGILLALGIAALSTIRAKAPVEVVEPIDWDADAADDSAPAGPGYERGLGYTAAVSTTPEKSAEVEDEASVPTR